MSQVNIILKKPNEKLGGAILITGFHGIGFTGYISVKYMIDTLNAKLIGYIETKRFPPFVFMNKGKLQTPFEIYQYRKLIFILTETLPHPKDLREFSKALVNWCIENKFREAVLIGGLDNKLRESDNDIIKCAYTSAYRDKLKKLRIPVLEKLYVAGPLALMLSKFEIMNFPAIALLPYADTERPDPLAASVAIEIIKRMYNLKINTYQLKEDAQRIEEEINELLKQKTEEDFFRQSKAYY